MAAKYKLKDVSQLAGREIFVDANVLIYLFWPTGTLYWETNYARTFAQLLRQKNPLLVDFIVLSEVINRVMRLEHNKMQDNQQDVCKYKDFRDSREGRETLSDIYLIVKEGILKHFKIIGKIFGQKDIEAFLILDELDFMDKSTACICRDNNFVLLTNDKDFGNAGIDIITGNMQILKP